MAAPAGPLYWQEFPDGVAIVKIVPPPQALTDQPAGAISVKAVRANWLLAGLLRVKVKAFAAAPMRGELAVTVTAGGLAFDA
jgi:hypothetical protein